MTEPNGMKRLVREVHRRSLWQVMILYMATSWAVLEAADHVIQRFGMPDWAYGTAVLLLLIGFPVVMATAIVQEGVGPERSNGSREADGPGAGPPPAERGAAAGAATPSDVSAETPGTSARAAPSHLARLFTWRNALLGGVAAFGLWGVVATGLLLTSGGRGTAAGGTDERDARTLKAIAVLPFANLSAEAENAYFADGMHEDVLTQLSKIGDLTVISRTSVLPYRETDKSLREIAAELGVGSILEGSVRRSGDNVRISAQLIDAATDQHLWADNFDRGLTAANVFSIQTEIARQIADALRATLSPEEETRIAHVPTTDLTAYDLYIRAREAYQRYQADANEEAIRLFKQAIAADPEYAEPWAGLADGYFQRVQFFGYPPEWADSAEVHARRAIELNPESATGYKALAVALSARDRVRESLQANLEAIARDPNHYAAVNNAGTDYGVLGQFDEAMRWYRRSTRLNPVAFGPANAVSAYAAVQAPETATRLYAEVVDQPQFNPVVRGTYELLLALYLGDVAWGLQAVARWREELADSPWFWTHVAHVQHMAGDFVASRAASEHASELAPGGGLGLFFDVNTILGYAMLRTGNADEGGSLLERRAATIRDALANGADHPVFFWELAAILAARGRIDEALEHATAGRETGVQPALGFLRLNPMLEPIRDHPTIVALIEESRRDLEQQRQRIEAEEIEAGPR